MTRLYEIRVIAEAEPGVCSTDALTHEVQDRLDAIEELNIKNVKAFDVTLGARLSTRMYEVRTKERLNPVRPA